MSTDRKKASRVTRSGLAGKSRGISKQRKKNVIVTSDTASPNRRVPSDRNHTPLLKRSPPNSLLIIKQVEVDWHPFCVCHYKGQTYVGRSTGEIDRIDSNGHVTTGFIGPRQSFVEGLIAHNDRLYSSMMNLDNKSRIIYVHDLAGNLFNSWLHPDGTSMIFARVLAVINDKILVPDTTKRTFIFYSLDGQPLRSIPYDFSVTGRMSLCKGTDDDSIFVTSADTNTVIKFNLKMGATDWTATNISLPLGVSLYGTEYLICVDYVDHQVKLWVLRQDTGELVAELTDSTQREESGMYDLCVDGDTVIIPRYSDNSILYYKLLPAEPSKIR